MGLAKTEVIESEINRLTAWLDKVPRGIFHSHNLKKKDIVPQMRYLHLSRREMYDIMGTELVVLRLKEQLYQNELIKNLNPIQNSKMQFLMKYASQMTVEMPSIK